MFALGLRYLNGWSMAAADGARKQEAEWPPHPDRVFMALAAAWFETGEDEGEGDALRWLERLQAPEIQASHATRREVVASHVPVNDTRLGKLPTNQALDALRKAGLGLLPEHRLRKERSFPVAVPRNPEVYLIWPDDPSGHAPALANLAGKVTHVGHSASFVQAWLQETGEPRPTLMPTAGVAEHRLRVPNAGRLAHLARTGNRRDGLDYHDLAHEIERARTELKEMKPPPRVAWANFPDVVLLSRESETRHHPEYRAAKSGDATAATRLVAALAGPAAIAEVRQLLAEVATGDPVLVGANAYERDGFNAIPAALAQLLGHRLGLPCDNHITQTNIVGHTGADGYGRLARQAAFDGEVAADRAYVLVDDFVGQGGTLANLRGWIEKRGGRVIGAVTLTGKPYSAKLNPTKEQLDELRGKHGHHLEKWWRQHFGHTFDCLTQSEARYLARSPDVDTIRGRLAAAMRAGGGRRHARSPREQRRHLTELKGRLAEHFPSGPPTEPTRPTPGKWQGYTRRKNTPPDSDIHSLFDPRIVVLAIEGRRLSLRSTLKLTAALRGLLMRKCPEQPPPAWFSGHARGRPTRMPHLALAPLPFVGTGHADGRIMGLALILPRDLAPEDAGRALNAVLHDSETGLPSEHRLFDGEWFECAVALDTREQPPTNLDPRTWSAPSRTWASVTPVALNRHFDGVYRWDHAAESVRDACEHIGLPRPRDVVLQPVSTVQGVPHAREFPPLARKSDGGRRVHAHALLVFDEPVSGPVLVGAGRFRGYGLCRPINRE